MRTAPPAAGLAVLLVAGLATGRAHADEPELEPEVVESRRSFKLFDNRRTVAGMELFAGPLWSRRVQDTAVAEDRRGFERGAPLASEIGFGAVQMTPYAPFYLIGVTGSTLRVLDDKSFSFAILQQEVGGGIVLGPFEPDVRVRVGLATVDIMHAQPSAQLLTPGVNAGLALRLGKLRIDARGNADYLWRWFGSDYVVRSFTIGLRLDIPPKTPFPAARD